MNESKSYQRIEREIRCFNCNKFLTKIIFFMDTGIHNITIEDLTKLHMDYEIKIGLETKCRGCKLMDNKVFVV